MLFRKTASTIVVALTTMSALIFLFQNGTTLPNGSQAFMPLEVGGSNFVVWDLGTYRKGHEDDWYLPSGIKPLIGTFHMNPAGIEQQMRALYATGQRKIAFMLWFSDIGRNATSPGVYGHMVDSSGGRLLPQHEKNLRDILKLVNKIGFTQLFFRFGTNGTSDPSADATVAWSPWAKGWNETAYQQNWNFIVNTRKVVEEELSSTPVRRMYDLGVEIGGVEKGQAAAYQRRLWSDYMFITNGNVSDTYGFSMLPGDYLEKMIKNLKQTGTIPKIFAIDIYDDVGRNLKLAKKILRKFDIGGSEIILQETYANDPDVRNGVMEARSEGVNITTIMQWQTVRDSPQPHFSSINSMYNFNVYLTDEMKKTSVISSDYGCEDSRCIWILGRNLYSNSIIHVYNTNKVYLGRIDSSNRTFSAVADQNQAYTFRIPEAWWSPSILMSAPDTGFYFMIQNESTYTSLVYLPISKPKINSMGLGCDRNQCIWITTSNLASSQCSVTLYPGDWSSGALVVLNAQNGLNCQTPGVVTLEIPEWVRNKYTSLNVLVSNRGNYLWSEPKFLKIR